MDEYSYLMSECDIHCGLASLGKNYAGDEVAELVLVVNRIWTRVRVKGKLAGI